MEATNVKFLYAGDPTICCGSKKDILKYGTDNGFKFFFTCDLNAEGQKEYGCSTTLNRFLTFYNTIEPVDKTFYEVLLTDEKRFECYDFDPYYADVEPCHLKDFNEEFVYKQFKKLRSEFIRTTGRDTGYGKNSIKAELNDDNVRIMSSSNDEKISLHIINRDYAFNTKEEMKSFYEALQEFCIMKKQDGFHRLCYGKPDFSICSADRNMRIIGSTKYGQNRHMKPAMWHKPSRDCLINEFFITEDSKEKFGFKGTLEAELSIRKQELYKEKDFALSKKEDEVELSQTSTEPLFIDGYGVSTTELLKTSFGKIELLLLLISDSIKSKKNSLCDKTGKDDTKVVYSVLRNLSFSYISASLNLPEKTDEDDIEGIWLDIIWPLYRHKSDHNSKTVWNSLYNACVDRKDDKSCYTIKSLYFWARQNPLFATFYSPEKKEFDKNDDTYYFGDFKRELEAKTWESRNALVDYTVKNIGRVCHIVNDATDKYYLKIGRDNLFIKYDKISFTGKLSFKIPTEGEQATTKKTDFPELYKSIRSNINTFNRADFHPYDIYGSKKANHEHRVLNLFTGFKAQKLDEEVYKQKKTIYSSILGKVVPCLIKMFLEHIFVVWANNDVDTYTFIINWLQWIIKYPNKQTEVIIVILGRQGCGKGIVAEWLLKNFFGGPISVKTNALEKFTQQFNSLAFGKVFTVVDEGQPDSNKSQANFDMLKSLITDPTQTVEMKGVDCKQAINFNNFMYLTNHNNSFKVEEDDRRVAVLECNPVYKGNHEYFNTLSEALDNEDMPDVLFTYLYDREYLVKPASILPKTEAKETMKIVSLDMVGKFFHCLANDEFKIKFKEIEKMIDNSIFDDNITPSYTIRVSDNENTAYKEDDKRKYIPTTLLYEIFKHWIVLFGEKTNIYSLIKFSTASKQYTEHKRIRLQGDNKVSVIDISTNRFL